MSDIFSEPIHEWFHERYPDPEHGAYLNYDQVITIVSKPINLKVFYRIEYLEMNCWITYGGAQPAKFSVLYADPKMFDLIEARLNLFEEWERESIRTLGKFWDSYR